ncbi:MAG: MarR family transcriptional regulator [Myxococcales bacterium]|nr:MarR family transcriptional regulator [Myxococcales bacterium]
MPRRTLSQVEKLQASSLGYLLIRCSQIWGDRAIAAVNAEAGAPVLREAHTRLLPHLQTPDGIRITELAKAVGVTKQATQPLVAELAEQGIVRIETDREDARAKRVFLTEFGLEALLHGTGILLRIEEDLAPHLGPRARHALKTHLATLRSALEATASAAHADTSAAAAPPKRPPAASVRPTQRRRNQTR